MRRPLITRSTPWLRLATGAVADLLDLLPGTSDLEPEFLPGVALGHGQEAIGRLRELLEKRNLELCEEQVDAPSELPGSVMSESFRPKAWRACRSSSTMKWYSDRKSFCLNVSSECVSRMVTRRLFPIAMFASVFASCVRYADGGDVAPIL